MIKLVASDIDGTLIADSSDKIYPEMIEMIREMKRKGIIFVAASGRGYESLRYLFDEVKDEIAYISNNGACISYQGKHLYIKEVKRDYVSKIIEECRKYQDSIHLMIGSKEGVLIETKDEKFIDLLELGYHNKVSVVANLLEDEIDVLKISLYRKGSIRDLGEGVFIPKWKDKVHVCMAGQEWVDFMNSEVDKGEALVFLQEYFGVTHEETAVFGDNSNDIGLMKKAEESYAVVNAVKEVKENAKYSCPHFSEKGVYQILKKII